MASRSFFSPRSTVKATTSQPWSLSQRMATDVSRPPEYARTTFLLMVQQVSERAAGLSLPEHGDDRVVAGHGPGDAGQRRLVDAARDEVGRARWRPDHGHRLDELDRQHELAHQR